MDKRSHQLHLNKIGSLFLLLSLWLVACTTPSGVGQDRDRSTPIPQPSPLSTLTSAPTRQSTPTSPATPTSTPTPHPLTPTPTPTSTPAHRDHLIFFGSGNKSRFDNFYLADANCIEAKWSCDEDLTQLTNLLASSTDDQFPSAHWQFSVSADGDQVALAIATDGYSYSDSSEIYVFDIDLCARTPGGCTLRQLRRLTHNNFYDGNPVWSPNGDWIVFETWRQSERILHKIRPDGTDEQPFLKEDAAQAISYAATAPAWSPDGRQLAFSIEKKKRKEGKTMT